MTSTYANATQLVALGYNTWSACDQCAEHAVSTLGARYANNDGGMPARGICTNPACPGPVLVSNVHTMDVETVEWQGGTTNPITGTYWHEYAVQGHPFSAPHDGRGITPTATTYVRDTRFSLTGAVSAFTHAFRNGQEV